MESDLTDRETVMRNYLSNFYSQRLKFQIDHNAIGKYKIDFLRNFKDHAKEWLKA